VCPSVVDGFHTPILSLSLSGTLSLSLELSGTLSLSLSICRPHRFGFTEHFLNSPRFLSLSLVTLRTSFWLCCSTGRRKKEASFAPTSTLVRFLGRVYPLPSTIHMISSSKFPLQYLDLEDRMVGVWSSSRFSFAAAVSLCFVCSLVCLLVVVFFQFIVALSSLTFSFLL
jgi:hypothetical protein